MFFSSDLLVSSYASLCRFHQFIDYLALIIKQVRFPFLHSLVGGKYALCHSYPAWSCFPPFVIDNELFITPPPWSVCKWYVPSQNRNLRQNFGWVPMGARENARECWGYFWVREVTLFPSPEKSISPPPSVQHKEEKLKNVWGNT